MGLWLVRVCGKAGSGVKLRIAAFHARLAAVARGVGDNLRERSDRAISDGTWSPHPERMR